MFEIRGITKTVLAIVAIAVFLWRGITMVSSAYAGDETSLLAFPFTVIFPAILIVILSNMKPTKTREGLLMRFGTLIHLLLIVSLPDFALYLALGFPFVFLSVELFETRLPKRVATPLTKLVLA